MEQLLQQFVTERLDGDINRLAEFDLRELRYDETYGCPDRGFDCDDTNLMRAVYCVVFADAWTRMSSESVEKKILRGDTMNSRATLVGRKKEEGLRQSKTLC